MRFAESEKSDVALLPALVGLDVIVLASSLSTANRLRFRDDDDDTGDPT